MIVAICGKSGKTTTAVNLATALAQRPISRRSQRCRAVLGLDADPQGSWSEWSAQRTTPRLLEVRAHTAPTLVRDLPGLLEGVDDLVIDLPAGTGRVGRSPDERQRVIHSAILAALSDDHGVVLGVVAPSPWELWVSDDLADVIARAWHHPGVAPNARTRTRLLLNRAGVTRRGGQGRPDRVPRMVRAAQRRLEKAPMPVMDTVIHQREEFVLAPLSGLGVTEFAPKSQAANEVRALATELLTLTGEDK